MPSPFILPSHTFQAFVISKLDLYKHKTVDIPVGDILFSLQKTGGLVPAYCVKCCGKRGRKDAKDIIVKNAKPSTLSHPFKKGYISNFYTRYRFAKLGLEVVINLRWGVLDELEQDIYFL